MQNTPCYLQDMLELTDNTRQLLIAERPFLQQQEAAFRAVICQWAETRRLVTDEQRPFLLLDDFYTALISGDYGQAFHDCLYRQGLRWYRLGLDETSVSLLLSRMARYLAGQQIRADKHLLAQALQQVVDLSTLLVMMIYQLGRDLQCMQQTAEHEIRRISQTFSILSASLPQQLLQAYIQHQQWKSRFFTLLLQDKSEPFLITLEHCPLTHWIQKTSLQLLPANQRQDFVTAHQHFHELAEYLSLHALHQHPEQIRKHLGELARASDVISRLLLESIDRNLSEIAVHDPLTGLHNRNTLQSSLHQLRSLAQRLTMNLGMILIDVDRFKPVNDHFGHLVGDQVLCEIAVLVSQTLRTEDQIFRWGGEEFLVLGLFDRNNNGAVYQLAERIRQRIETHSFCKDRMTLHLTVSAGAIEFSPHADLPVHTLFDQADRLLYAAKRQGRNQIHYTCLQTEVQQ